MCLKKKLKLIWTQMNIRVISIHFVTRWFQLCLWTFHWTKDVSDIGYSSEADAVQLWHCQQVSYPIT